MGRVYDSITGELELWLGAQPMFFVATATSDPDTRVNLSPRGLDTFRVLGPDRVAWLDLTGSGVETIAHLRADGRVTLMFCAFDDPPQIIRLHGYGRVHEPGDEEFGELRPRFPDLPDGRAIIDVAVERVASSCGYGVPRMELLGPRDRLLGSARRKGPEKLAEYRARRNAQSIDGLPGLVPDRAPVGNPRSAGRSPAPDTSAIRSRP
ncbi:MAG TPA: pyridoxamine 5'-phosphate oxidase family protein [Rubrobacter sp.]|nr:pyridoxamine 5'-phosphate oxidase family protein [Rubrobacter sp.]